jgi:cysteine synthase B
MLGAALGFPVLLAMPSNVSPERKRILEAYGAQIDWTDPDKGSDGAIRRARELAGNDPDRFFYADQYSNDANWLAHYRTTGPEIWQQTGGRGHPLCCRPGHQRHFHGHHAAPQGAQPRSRPSASSPTRPSTAWKA